MIISDLFDNDIQYYNNDNDIIHQLSLNDMRNQGIIDITSYKRIDTRKPLSALWEPMLWGNHGRNQKTGIRNTFGHLGK